MKTQEIEPSGNLQTFIASVKENPNAIQPVYPPDPGPLFTGLLQADNRNREEISRINPTLCTHDPQLYKHEETGMYYTCSSGAGGTLRRSRDLVHWEYVGPGMRQYAPPAAVEWAHYNDSLKPRGFSAPEVHRTGEKEYRMYYAVSTWGHRQSYIGMARSEGPEGPFIDAGPIVTNTEASPVNALDANWIRDPETGAEYMNFGSFWGGIRQIQLDPATGLRLMNGQPYHGREIWKRHHNVDRAVEGAYEIWNPDTGYFYMFTSYDCTNLDYNIRVARSRSISGPFYDHNGVEVNNTATGTDPDAIGLKIVDCHQFEDHFGWAATGHNGILREGDHWLISYHSHPTANLKASAQRIHLMIFDEEGWPLVFPCQYTGEKLQKLDPALIPGIYERILFDKPDGKRLCRQSRRMYLRADGAVWIDGQPGNWKFIRDYELELTAGGLTDHTYVVPAFDTDRGVPTLALTGRRSDGICTWGKKRSDAAK